jgi:hypothetical protein
MQTKLTAAALGTAAIFWQLSAQAQAPNRWAFRQFQVDNDLFHYPYSHVGDRFYTSGLKVAFGKGVYESPDDRESLPLWLRPVRKACAGCVIYPNFSIGQQMYTPEDLENPDPQPGERPWAAWMYASLGGTIDTSDTTRHDVEVQIGVTGDLAGGEFGQKFWHELTSSPVPLGWDNQFGPDVGINAFYNFQHIWITSAADSRMEWDFVPSVKAAVGTMKTNAGIGGMFRVGRNITDFPYVPLRPTSRRNPTALPHLEIYGFMGADIRAVAYNYFLEGSLYRDEPYTVDPKRYVWDLTFGVTARFRRYNVSYAVVRRSEEFVRTVGDRNGVHEFGSLSFTVGIR